MTSRVFISYAHGRNDAHVAALIAALQAAGLQVASDRDVNTPQGPPEGWPSWMLDRIDEADWVLVVCDEAYYRRFRGTETFGLGLGARWEGSNIGTALYNEGSRNWKFVPVLFDDESIQTIPEPLRGSTRYLLPAELPKLLSALSGASGTAKTERVAEGKWTPAKSERRSSWTKFPPYALLLLGSLLAGLLLVALIFRNTGSHPPPPTNFPLTVYVHGPAGQQDLPLRNDGAVLLDLGGDRRREPIGDRGQAVFSEIPASFRGREVNILLDAAKYERTDNSPVPLDVTSIYLKVRRKPSHITGNVTDTKGRPVPGATVSLVGIAKNSGPQGQFDFTLAHDQIEDPMVLRVVADGYQAWSQEVLPNGGPVTVVMER